MKIKVISIIVLCGLIIVLSGCAGMVNNAQKTGGYLVETASDYVVIVYSGPVITDVYKLHNQYVQSEHSSDGINFIDNEGNVRIIDGPSTVIRIKNGTLDQYVEYHMVDAKYRKR